MQSTATVPAAGWFPDPGGSGGQRWWSGEEWTEYMRDHEVAVPAHLRVVDSIEPVVAPPAPPTPPAPPLAPADDAPAFADMFTRTAAPLIPAGMHAAPDPLPAAPPAVSLASTTVGFTSSVDPAVANRYRLAAMPEAPAPSATQDLGWQGSPVTGGALGPQPTWRVPEKPYSNPAAVLALLLGLGSVAAIATWLLLGVPSIVGLGLAGVAVICGIVGIVVAARAKHSVAKAVVGLISGIVTFGVFGAVLVLAFLAVGQALSGSGSDATVEAIEDSIVSTTAESGYDFEMVSCPSTASMVPLATFQCVGTTAAGESTDLVVTVSDDGSTFTIQPTT